MAELGCLKDGYFNNLEVNNLEVENFVIIKKNSRNVFEDANLTKYDCGLIFLNGSSTSANASLSKTITINLPTTETGLHYKFILNASMTHSNGSFVINANNASLTGIIDYSTAALEKHHATDSNKKIIFGKDTAPGDFVDLNCYKDNEISKWIVFGSTKYLAAQPDGLYFRD